MGIKTRRKRGRPAKQPTCPKCRSKRSHSKGYQFYADGSRSNDRKCLDCGRRYLI